MSRISFDVGPARAKHSPSVKSVGITGQLAGSRADLIVADDIEVPNNSQTQVMRDKLSESIKEFDAIIKPGGRIGYLGTPQTEQSIYNKLPERGYAIRVWPARFPDRAQAVVYGDRLAPIVQRWLDANPSLVKKSTDPKRFSDLDLMERELSYGRSGFALQFMLDTRLSDFNRYPLKVADLLIADVGHAMGPQQIIWAGSEEYIVRDLPNVSFTGDNMHKPMSYATNELGQPLMRPWEGCVMAIDPSGRGKDETGYAIGKYLNGQIFVPACGGFRGGYSDETLTALAEMAKLHQVKQIIIEPNFGDGMFNKLLEPFLQRIYPCTVVDAERSNAQKEKRIIDVLEPVMNQHRLIIDPKVIRKDFESAQDLPPEEAMQYQLIYQLTRITKEKGALLHDDRLDALALMVHYWSEVMNAEQTKNIQAYKDELLDRELERFMHHAVGHTPAADTWFTN